MNVLFASGVSRTFWNQIEKSNNIGFITLQLAHIKLVIAPIERG